MSERIAIIGLGYVGLPVAVGFARQFEGTIGFDIDRSRIHELREGHDRTNELTPEQLGAVNLEYTDDPARLADATAYVVTVPTPIDGDRRPNLKPLESASRSVGAHLKKGDVVVYESTVYPGVTRDFCGPILAEVSGLEQGVDFHLGYSPERINPGDKKHTLERITKVVSGDDDATLARVAELYEAIITEASVHRAPSLEVAESAKVIENTQRDLNIALMNELSMIFDRLDIPTTAVLDAAATKWNFLRFTPGLVGGHCIGVDPYYLTARAESVGYHPQVILAGRRVNDGMGGYVARRLVKFLARSNKQIAGARVGVLGLTFKENVPDLRNSRVPDIVEELAEFGISAICHDPMAEKAEIRHEMGLETSDLGELTDLDALILAVPHEAYLAEGAASLAARVRDGGAFMDVKSAFTSAAVADARPDLDYWAL